MYVGNKGVLFELVAANSAPDSIQTTRGCADRYGQAAVPSSLTSYSVHTTERTWHDITSFCALYCLWEASLATSLQNSAICKASR